jgi:DNA mismatch endonuclease (patch repair protein)
MPGRPDFVFKKQSLALFIDGCFWHGCLKCNLRPKTNIKYWAKKIQRNRNRDKIVKKQLEQEGWTVIRIWEHQLDNFYWLVRKINNSLLVHRTS